MLPQPTRRASLGWALRLRCPRCGRGRLFGGLFAMHDACRHCGLAFVREPGFYLGSIYLNYGATVIAVGGLYALVVLGLGLPHEAALAACLVVAVVLPILLFRHARSLLLALDTAVNRHQAEPAGAAGGPEIADLSADDATAGCLMGVVLCLIILFGLSMAAVTLVFSGPAAPTADHGPPPDEVDLR